MQARSSKKNRCTYIDCNFLAMRLIGQCNHCDNFYCQLHRIPERHECKNLVEIINQKRIHLTNKLMNEKIKNNKIFI